MNKTNKTGFITLIHVCFFVVSTQAWSLAPPSKAFKIKTAPIELESFALAVRDYMNAGETSMLADSVDFNAISEKAVKFLVKSPQVKSSKVSPEQAKSTLASQFKVTLVNRLNSIFSAESEWTYNHHRIYKKNHYLNFRISSGEVTEYLETKMSFKTGRWKIVDWYMYSTNIWVSDALLGAAKLTQVTAHGESSSNLNGSQILRAMSNPHLAPDVFKKLSKKHKKNNVIQSIYLASVTSLDEQNYIEALDLIVPELAHDQFLLIKLGYHRLKNNDAAALKYLEQLNQSLGGDLNLALLKAEIFLGLGKKNESLDILIKAIDASEDEYLVYFTALILLAQEGWYEAATRVLDVLNVDFDTLVNKETINEISELQPFANSDAFAVWLNKNS